MGRNIPRPLMLGLAVAFAQACSGANATGRAGDQPANPASRVEAHRPVVRDLTLPAGQTLELRMENGLTSRTNHAGDPIAARAVTAAVGAEGDTVIPVGAVFRGTVREIAAAPTPRAKAHLGLAFTEVQIGDSLRPIEVRVTAMATQLKGRGVTGGTVAKVGAGALVGGLAGRLIGRNTTGTVIGAAAGAAAGGVYAHETRDLDIILPPGGAVRVAIAAPFHREVAVK